MQPHTMKSHSTRSQPARCLRIRPHWILLLSLYLFLPVPTAALSLVDSKEPSNEGSVTSNESADGYQDRHLRQRVLLRLYGSPSLAGSVLDVHMTGDGVAELDGVVASELHRQRAVRIARSTLGVYQTIDRLEIDGAQVEARRSTGSDDQALAERAAAILTGDVFETAESRKTWIFGYEIDGFSWEFDLDVDDGIASLEGTVARQRDITRAAAALWEIPGIRAVRVDLRIEDDDSSLSPLLELLRPYERPIERPTLPPTIDSTPQGDSSRRGG